MIITYLRSSSYSTWDFCQTQGYLRYTLGFPDPGNFKATKGTLVHKALELLARKKLASQNNQVEFHDSELEKTWAVDNFTPNDAIQEAWSHYSTTTPFDWQAKDYKDVKKWMLVALEFNDGMLSPLKRTVVQPEQHFDFLIEKDWARYEFPMPDGTINKGYLGLKGTVDLILAVDEQPDVLEYIDFKSGKRLDWASGEPKDYAKLRDDPQMRLYHYALSRLYPEAKSIIVTIFYLQDGGPFSLPFSREDIPITEAMIRKRFETIRDCEMPKRIKPNWRCGKLCQFEKVSHPDAKHGESLCDFIHGELKTLGMDRVTKKYMNVAALSEYTGGGKTITKAETETK